MTRKEKAAIKAVQACLGPELLKSKWRKLCEASKRKYCGQCSNASEAVYEILGGKEAGYTPERATYDARRGLTHWWLRSPSGELLDPTAAQFPKSKLPGIYAKGRGGGFPTPQSKRPSKNTRAILACIQRRK